LRKCVGLFAGSGLVRLQEGASSTPLV